MNKQKYVKLFIGLMFGILSLAACTNTQTTLDNMDKNTPDLKTSDMFTDQDMESGYEKKPVPCYSRRRCYDSKYG